MQSLTADDLQAYITQHDLSAEVLRLPEETPTVDEAARVVGSTPDQIVKSVLFMVNTEPYLCIASGTARISYRKLAGRLGVGRKRVKLADAQAVLNHTGYRVGTVPPFGHTLPLVRFIDPRVLEEEVIYAGGGDIDALVRMRSEDLQAHIQAEELDLTDDDQAAGA